MKRLEQDSGSLLRAIRVPVATFWLSAIFSQLSPLTTVYDRPEAQEEAVVGLEVLLDEVDVLPVVLLILLLVLLGVLDILLEELVVLIRVLDDLLGEVKVLLDRL